MKNIKFFAMAALAALVMACGGNKPFDKSKVNDLADKALSFTSEDYAEAVTQLDGLLTYFESEYGAENLKDASMAVFKGEEPFGGETELYKKMNQISNGLFGHEDEMDEATKAAYEKYLERRKALGLL